ncbi:MAG TPA: hypothetical protein VNX21_02110, partial [Candidatus Thermoplasmatota archaeon]|nr:hypothetical protein [Candidatus Thermoplasmatota archaeon]
MDARPLLLLLLLLPAAAARELDEPLALALPLDLGPVEADLAAEAAVEEPSLAAEAEVAAGPASATVEAGLSGASPTLGLALATAPLPVPLEPAEPRRIALKLEKVEAMDARTHALPAAAAGTNATDAAPPDMGPSPRQGTGPASPAARDAPGGGEEAPAGDDVVAARVATPVVVPSLAVAAAAATAR